MERTLKLLEIYLGTIEKVSDRRAQSNAWMLSVNGAIVGLYGYLQADKAVIGAEQAAIWLWAIPVAGMIISTAWIVLLTSFRKLNRAKFAVLAQLESGLPLQPFTREREVYRAENRISFSTIEMAIPVCFFLLYVVILVAGIALYK